MDYLPKDWVDPHDMRKYDRVNKKMKSLEETKTSESAKNDNCTKHRGNLERFEIFLERFVNHVLSTANLKVTFSIWLKYSSVYCSHHLFSTSRTKL